MDRKVKSFRLRVDLLGWVESYAAVRGSSQIAVVESALEVFRGMSEGGVPDLPVVEEPAPRVTQHEPKPKSVPFTPASRVAGRDEIRQAEQEMRAAVWARQAKLNEAKERASK